jgi:putative ABC transport system ATP-binding protein
VIQVTGLNRVHNPGRPNQFQSLYDIDLHVKEGELVILQGVSGSGKTTLLSIIGALDRPTSGEVVVDGQQVARLPDLHASAFRATTIGFVFQEFNLFEEFTVCDNVTLPLIPRGLAREQIDLQTGKAMGLARIDHKAGQRVRDLSGGEKQRCSIARALVADPSVILCDEPTANLDLENSLSFIEILGELKGLGKTIIVATHDPLFEACDFTDRVALIDGGRIVTG